MRPRVLGLILALVVACPICWSIEGDSSASTLLTPSVSCSGGRVSFDSGLLYIDCSNNYVGVLNTSPAYALDVTGALQVSGQSIVKGSATVYGSGGMTVTYGVTVGTITGNGAALTSLTAANISAGSLGTGVIAQAATIPGSSFSVGGSTFVVTGGKVGIGTASPYWQFQQACESGDAICHQIYLNSTAAGNDIVFANYATAPDATTGMNFILEGSSGTYNSSVEPPSGTRQGVIGWGSKSAVTSVLRNSVEMLSVTAGAGAGTGNIPSTWTLRASDFTGDLRSVLQVLPSGSTDMTVRVSTGDFYVQTGRLTVGKTAETDSTISIQARSGDTYVVRVSSADGAMLGQIRADGGILSQTDYPNYGGISIFLADKSQYRGYQGGILRLQASSGTIGTPLVGASSDQFGTISFEGYNSSGTLATGATIIGSADGSQQDVFGSWYWPGRLDFQTNNATGSTTTRMTIRASGNVGIGTSAPVAKLDVAGTIAYSVDIDTAVTVPGRRNVMGVDWGGVVWISSSATGQSWQKVGAQ